MLRNLHEIKQIGESRVLDIYLYGEIKAKTRHWWTGEIEESTTSAEHIRGILSEAGAVDSINIYINSCGGSVSEGIAIYNQLKRQTAYKTVYIDAYAYSIASVIAMAGDKVVLPSNTTMMIHNAMMGCFGNSKELRKAADDLDVINEASCNSYLIKAGEKISREKLNELLEAETFLGADQALELGLVDEIANPVDISKSTEVVEQAKKNRNPLAKCAEDFLQKAKSIPPKNPPKTEPDGYEIALKALEKYL
jgi:ATP-dependent protease ClpP protease subunit